MLEDPGLPNGATVAPDEYYQRCLPTTNRSLPTGASLGPCPVCQNSGAYFYGQPTIPASVSTLPSTHPPLIWLLWSVERRLTPKPSVAWHVHHLASHVGSEHLDVRGRGCEDVDSCRDETVVYGVLLRKALWRRQGAPCSDLLMHLVCWPPAVLPPAGWFFPPVVS